MLINFSRNFSKKLEKFVKPNGGLRREHKLFRKFDCNHSEYILLALVLRSMEVSSFLDSIESVNQPTEEPITIKKESDGAASSSSPRTPTENPQAGSLEPPPLEHVSNERNTCKSCLASVFTSASTTDKRRCITNEKNTDE
jgi:hypothetical protein